jgi:hypothetical protein
MPLHLRDAVEGRGGNDDVEMAAFARTGMADVTGTVVADFEQRRIQRLFERRAQAFNARHSVHEALSLPNSPRSAHNTTAIVKTMAMGGAIQTLNNTQSDSLRFSATQMLTRPSAT